MTSRRARAWAAADPDEVWLTVHEAGELLGVSPATLRRWAVAGEVEAFTTPGGHRRFARSVILALLPPRNGSARDELTTCARRLVELSLADGASPQEARAHLHKLLDAELGAAAG